MRLIKEILVVENQPVVALGNGKPCPHCRDRREIPVTGHLLLWTVPRALVLYTGGDEIAVCLDCLEKACR